MKNYVVVPTYNEAENLSSLLPLLPSDLLPIIVDDNSPDGTAEIARKQGAIVIQRESKQGLGSAVRAGIRKALEDRECERVITMDADFSHSPSSISYLLSSSSSCSSSSLSSSHSPSSPFIPQLLTSSSFVIGSRYVKGGKIVGWSIKRKIISKTANLLALPFTHLHDNTSNFRIYSRQAAEVVVGVEGRDNEWLIACLIALRRARIRGKEVPVTFVNRTVGKSKLRWQSALRLGIVIVKAGLWKRGSSN